MNTEAQLQALRDHFSNYPGQAPLLYTWELVTFSERDAQQYALSECQNLITSVWCNQLKINLPPPNVLDGRGSACARVVGTTIHLPRWARNDIIIMHELAHCVTDLIDAQDSIDHGPSYVQVYLTLLALRTGHKYSILRKSVKKHGIKVQKLKFGEQPCN